MAALACEAPAQGRAPNQPMDGAEIADELKKREASWSRFHPGTPRGLLKKGDLQPYRFRYWLTEVPDEHRDEKIVQGV